MVEHPSGRTVTVDAGDPRVVRGLAVPFGEEVVVISDHGEPITEIMDERSFDAPPGVGIPLLTGYRRDEAATGVVRTTHVRSYGLSVEAELLVGADELDAGMPASAN